MNKSELIPVVANKLGITSVQSEKVINALMKTVQNALKNGDKVKLKGLGTFYVRERSERMGYNPNTGKRVEYKASRSPAFKPEKALKEIIDRT